MKWRVQLDNSVIIPSKTQKTIFFEHDINKIIYFYAVESNAVLTYFFIPPISCEQVHITFQMHANSSLFFYTAIQNSCSVILQFQLNGERANVNAKGFYILDESQKVKVQTVQDHCAPNTESTVSIKGILAGKSIADYEGEINIKSLGSYAIARQQNKNILLSGAAKVNTKPQLQVETNDVHCTHGSAVGQLDAQHLFYMQSRGIEESSAQKLLIKGFLIEILDQLPSDMLGTIQKKLDSMIRIL